MLITQPRQKKRKKEDQQTRRPSADPSFPTDRGLEQVAHNPFHHTDAVLGLRQSSIPQAGTCSHLHGGDNHTTPGLSSSSATTTLPLHTIRSPGPSIIFSLLQLSITAHAHTNSTPLQTHRKDKEREEGQELNEFRQQLKCFFGGGGGVSSLPLPPALALAPCVYPYRSSHFEVYSVWLEQRLGNLNLILKEPAGRGCFRGHKEKKKILTKNQCQISDGALSAQSEVHHHGFVGAPRKVIIRRPAGRGDYYIDSTLTVQRSLVKWWQQLSYWTMTHQKQSQPRALTTEDNRGGDTIISAVPFHKSMQVKCRSSVTT